MRAAVRVVLRLEHGSVRRGEAPRSHHLRFAHGLASERDREEHLRRLVALARESPDTSFSTRRVLGVDHQCHATGCEMVWKQSVGWCRRAEGGDGRTERPNGEHQQRGEPMHDRRAIIGARSLRRGVNYPSREACAEGDALRQPSRRAGSRIAPAFSLHLACMQIHGHVHGTRVHAHVHVHVHVH